MLSGFELYPRWVPLTQLLLPRLARANLIHSFSRVNSLFHHLLYGGRRHLRISSRLLQDSSSNQQIKEEL